MSKRNKNRKVQNQKSVAYVIQPYAPEGAKTAPSEYTDWETVRRVALALVDFYGSLEITKHPASERFIRLQRNPDSVTVPSIGNAKPTQITRKQFAVLDEPSPQAWGTKQLQEVA